MYIDSSEVMRALCRRAWLASAFLRCQQQEHGSLCKRQEQRSLCTFLRAARSRRQRSARCFSSSSKSATAPCQQQEHGSLCKPEFT